MPAPARSVLYFDVVRGASAQLVLLGHAANLFFPGLMMQMGTDGMWTVRDDRFYVQNLGVVVFFVLSGYLVTRSLARKPDAYGPGDYVVDRAARIFVPFVPAVLLIWLCDTLVFTLSGRTTPFLPLHLDVGTVLANVTMIYDNPVVETVSAALGAPVHLERLGTAAPFWSVSIEWWLYLAFGSVWFFVYRRSGRSVPLALLGVFAIGTSVGSLLGHTGAVLAWLVGMAYALVEATGRLSRQRMHVVLTVAAAMTIAGTAALGALDPYQPVATTAICVLIMSGYRSSRRFESRIDPSHGVHRLVARVSDVSYSLYLVHFPVLIYLTVLLHDSVPGVVGAGLGIVLGNVVALVFWWAFERHYRTVGTRLKTLLGTRSARYVS